MINWIVGYLVACYGCAAAMFLSILLRKDDPLKNYKWESEIMKSCSQRESLGIVFMVLMALAPVFIPIYLVIKPINIVRKTLGMKLILVSGKGGDS
jgi:hypothetical protein